MTYKKAFILILILIAFNSCNNQDDILLEHETNVQLDATKVMNCTICPTLNPKNVPIFSKNELIIQYAHGLSENDKINLRQTYSENDVIESIEICSYCDGTIEKWKFGPGIDLEHKKASIKARKKSKPEGLLNVDIEFSFGMENESLMSSTISNTNSYTSFISNNYGIVIAVLDSGIDYNYPYFTTTYLYDANISRNYYPSGSGWNFISNVDNCTDDYNLKHGTKVSYIINNTLNTLGVNHQILPIKISGFDGTASYFKILCGISFSANKADIVQMSFGWYGEDEGNDIFKDLIHDNSHVLYITSAGNNNTNTDIKNHFPSGFSHQNILSIAAINTMETDIASFSNYGVDTVDFYAPGENIAFPVSSIFTDYISGTSFAAPYVAAISAKILDANRGFTPQQIEQELVLYGTPIPARPTKSIKHNILIH